MLSNYLCKSYKYIVTWHVKRLENDIYRGLKLLLNGVAIPNAKMKQVKFIKSHAKKMR